MSSAAASFDRPIVRHAAWGRVGVDALWRIVDIVAAVAGLVFVAPLLVALAIWATDGGAPPSTRGHDGSGN